MRSSYQPITASNAKRILAINNRAMTAICKLLDEGIPVPTWGIADVSQRIAECEAILARQQREKVEKGKAAA